MGNTLGGGGVEEVQDAGQDLALIFFVIVWPYLFIVVGVRLQLQKSRKALTAHHEAIDGYLRGIASSATYTAPDTNDPLDLMLSDYEDAIFNSVRTEVETQASAVAPGERLELVMKAYARVEQLRVRIRRTMGAQVSIPSSGESERVLATERNSFG